MIKKINIKTSARLHMGFFDLSSQSARKFGSLGLSIDAFHTELTISDSSTGGETSPWVNGIFSQCLAQLGLNQHIFSVQLHSEIPRHAGLGSGTQMAMAIAEGVRQLAQNRFAPNEVFNTLPARDEMLAKLSRGARSGLGIATFTNGGLVIDGGRGSNTVIPPILAHYDFPEDWRVLLILDPAHAGVHGSQEKSAFQELVPKSLAETHQLCHALLMQAMPALVEHDFDSFAQVIGQLQTYNASYFARAQGGEYASPLVAEVLNDLKAQGYVGLGQSSWGATGFVLCPNQQSAKELLVSLKQKYAASQIEFLVCRGNNHGAIISN